MVLGTKSDTAYYTATMETAASPVENALFSNIDLTRTAISGITPAYPTDNTTNPNAYVAKTNASSGGQKIGPSLVLRVMAGDTIQINATGVYNSTAANTSIATQPDMVSAILNAFSGSGISDGIHGAFGIGSAISTGLTPGVFNSLKQIDTSQNLSTKPKAYLNFALFDDQFALVNENSGIRQIQGSPNVLQPLSVPRMVIKKTGFLYIYCSNESGSDVFFDNLVVAHNSGPLLEETHYYPFGLTMAGISNHALKGLNYPENRFKYNGKELQSGEFSDGSGLELYDYKHRSYDPQIGRFIQIDSLASRFEYLTPFQYASNDPIKNIDIDGLEGLISPILFGTQEPIMRGPVLESMLETGAKAADVGGKTAEVTTKSSSKFTPETLENFARGNKVEAERLAANGVEKNFKPIETLDPKTGQLGKTVPDAFENGGKSTLEVKNTKSQGLTKQLRLQENFSTGNGFPPKLDINKGAKLSGPLLKSSFKINYYSTIPAAIDNTALKISKVQL